MLKQCAIECMHGLIMLFMYLIEHYADKNEFQIPFNNNMQLYNYILYYWKAQNIDIKLFMQLRFGKMLTRFQVFNNSVYLNIN